MRTLLIVVVFSVITLAGCSTWHPVPADNSPAATLIETGERRGLTWYQRFSVSEIDELPVSHMGTNPGSATVRVTPGIRRLLIRVRFLHRDNPLLISGRGDCPCEARFLIEMDLRAGQRIEIGGSIEPSRMVNLRLLDLESPQDIYAELKQQALSIPQSGYIPLPSGGYIPIQRAR